MNVEFTRAELQHIANLFLHHGMPDWYEEHASIYRKAKEALGEGSFR